MLMIKCRTAEEAYLIMEQLAAANIIAISPGRAKMLQAYKEKGYVGIEISAQAYRMAKELHPVIESRSPERRKRRLLANAILSVIILILVLALWLIFLAGHWWLSGDL
jgi:hypothetical protein